MTTPSVGRIVHYRPEVVGAEVRPAIVVKVWSDTVVNLEVFGLETGEAQGRHPTSVMFSETSPRSWFWPPKV